MTGTTRWAPVAIILVAAPWFAEMSWGGYPFTDIPVILLFLAPMYGGAALLIRELTRRTGRGWPTILVLAAAFGVLQAGLVDQSLFNPSYDRFDFQHPAHVGGIDVSLYYLLAFVAGHVIASIAAPIMVAETWSRRGSEPWLTRRTTWVFAVLYALATLVNHLGVKEEAGHGFQARPLQSLTAAAAVLVLVAAALQWRRRPSISARVPPPWLLTALGFLAYLLYLPGENTTTAFVGLAVVVAAIGAFGTWSRSVHWTASHSLALVLGTILVGVVMPLWSEPYDDSVGATAELIADIGAAAICLAIVATTILRRRVLASAAVAATPLD